MSEYKISVSFYLLYLRSVTLRHGCSPVNLLHTFGTPFSNNTNGGLLLYVILQKINLFSGCNRTYPVEVIEN